MKRLHITFAPDPRRPTDTTIIPFVMPLSRQPVGILYRPPENKMRNAKPKDYLGKAKLVAAESATEAYTTFTGVTRMAQGYSPSGAPLDNRPDQMLSVGGGLAPSLSFSRARNPDTVKPLGRADSATARLERQNTTLPVNNAREAANQQRVDTTGSRNVISPPSREQTISPVRSGRLFFTDVAVTPSLTLLFI
jgi:hypothetical protein